MGPADLENSSRSYYDKIFTERNRRERGENFQVCSVGISERNTRKRGGKWRARKAVVGGEEEEEPGREWRAAVHRVPLSSFPLPLYFMAKLFWQKNNSISASVQVIVRVLSRDMLDRDFSGKRRVFFIFGQIRIPSIKSNLIFLRATAFFPIPLALIAPVADLVTANENEINEDSAEAEAKRNAPLDSEIVLISSCFVPRRSKQGWIDGYS